MQKSSFLASSFVLQQQNGRMNSFDSGLARHRTMKKVWSVLRAHERVAKAIIITRKLWGDIYEILHPPCFAQMWKLAQNLKPTIIFISAHEH